MRIEGQRVFTAYYHRISRHPASDLAGGFLLHFYVKAVGWYQRDIDIALQRDLRGGPAFIRAHPSVMGVYIFDMPCFHPAVERKMDGAKGRQQEKDKGQ